MATIDDLISVLGDGKANAEHAYEIENRLDMNAGHTQEPTRDLIRDAIVNHEIPIGSTPQAGYFLIHTEEELDEAVNNLQQRIRGRIGLRDFVVAGSVGSNHAQMAVTGQNRIEAVNDFMQPTGNIRGQCSLRLLHMTSFPPGG